MADAEGQGKPPGTQGDENVPLPPFMTYVAIGAIVGIALMVISISIYLAINEANTASKVFLFWLILLSIPSLIVVVMYLVKKGKKVKSLITRTPTQTTKTKV